MSNRFFNDHIRLPFIGKPGVDTVKRKRVLVIGAGGLGCPVISALASSGIGHLAIADGDRVETRNLARQYLYTPSQVGEFKTTAAITYLKTRYLDTTFEAYPVFVDAENVHSLVDAYDLVVDATDNFRSRALIGQACHALGRPQVYGAIFRSEGQVTAFNCSEQQGTLSDLFAIDGATMEGTPCMESGTYVVGSMVIGALMANEAIKVLLGLPDVLAGKMLLLDVLTLQQRIVHFPKPLVDSTAHFSE
ncbi:HesA/MoeB/ThiF family protein [Parapedobacter sp. 10938]|uniref:HesA/MoeB/ThiF family protein n=1 Tax=Parapedobacter flavus TaxID=3110225 RepID=UPI002DB57827|nr:HesA/MoeB/ThiF family protein [Parapedobacter sp. 10938]MEC3878215.1 HesA/MoeB/ThiF family protein [Parapedobacter sp. 10938]